MKKRMKGIVAIALSVLMAVGSAPITAKATSIPITIKQVGATTTAVKLAWSRTSAAVGGYELSGTIYKGSSYRRFSYRTTGNSIVFNNIPKNSSLSCRIYGLSLIHI